MPPINPFSPRENNRCSANIYRLAYADLGWKQGFFREIFPAIKIVDASALVSNSKKEKKEIKVATRFYSRE